MADISSYLAAILSAVYGEDVRGSIHDAIEVINDVSEVVLSTGTAVTGPTSSSTGFYRDSLYINVSTMELWKCIGTNSWQSQGVLKGADGNGIVDISKTSTSGLVDTYTITFDDGGTETFDVTNGEDGQNGSKWYKGTAITGTGSSITGFPGVKDDFYLNSTTGNVYVCVTTGGASVPNPAEWDYVMTLTGGGSGPSVTVVDNLTSTSSTDALSANQGRVLKGMVDGKQATLIFDTAPTQNSTNPCQSGGIYTALASKADSSSVPSDLDDLSDVTITTPSNNQVLKYNGSAWVNGAAPAGGHTMNPTPSSSVDEDDVVTAVNTAISTDGGANDEVASLYGVGVWSNVKVLTVLVKNNSSYTGLTATGLGTWQDPSTLVSPTKADEIGWGWVEIPELVGIGTDNDTTVRITYDSAKCGGALTLGGYIIDDSTGMMCVKFGNEIPSASVSTAVVGIEIYYRRNYTREVGQ